MVLQRCPLWGGILRGVGGGLLDACWVVLSWRCYSLCELGSIGYASPVYQLGTIGSSEEMDV